MMTEHTHEHDLGFHYDLPRMLGRRRVLGVIGGLAALVATPGAELAQTSEGVCVLTSRETEGPYPADGTNGRGGNTLNVLTQEGVIREDIRPSFAGMESEAEGVPLTVELQIMDSTSSCAPLAGLAVYLWHCDAVGRYSLYDLQDQNYLRGVGISDENGIVRFTTIFPGCYSGRWPHMHFEAFESIEHALNGRQSVLTSQISMPANECSAVYEQDGRYVGATRNLSRLSYETDSIFADNTEAQKVQQMMTLEGSAGDGYRGSVVIGLS
jgi:protocatechuate 3,4-dioxygenase beta subunit